MSEKHLYENKENLQMYAIAKLRCSPNMMALRLTLKKQFRLNSLLIKGSLKNSL